MDLSLSLPAESIIKKIFKMKFPCFLTKLYANVQYSSNFLNIFPFYPPIKNAISCVKTNLSLSTRGRRRRKKLYIDVIFYNHSKNNNNTSVEPKFLLEMTQKMTIIYMN